ncbi:MAG TPA: universal stress protein [Burkholderiaceae bacterium]|nr:universal stress protein [Burkholderiaceae bacterium]
MNASYQQLLVHLDATGRSRTRLDVARALAQQHGAALTALYAATPSYVAMPYPGGVASDFAVRIQAIDDERRGRARAIFDAAARQGEPLAAWSEVDEPPVIGAFAQQALFADLLVLGQHEPSGAESDEVPADFAEAVIATSGKPGLIIPYTGTFDRIGETVVIAWNASREAARAVAAALPLLQRARSVHILSWAAPDATVQGARLDLNSYLRQHGVRAQWHSDASEPPELADLLLSRAFDLQADLLVMGCYGHSRAREWVLGGTSRTVLRTMTLPVLMAH